MKRNLLIAFATCAAVSMSAQTAVDAYSISQNDLRGTARFMSMAGAFGALGGDISTLNQNPGGIGIYRSSDIGVTLDIDMQGSKTSPISPGYGIGSSQTKVACNNFGYVGTVALNNDVMPYFNWGASYSRVASFDRTYQGGFSAINGSMTNYIAGYTNAEGWSTNDLWAGYSDYNPYTDCAASWLGILAYNTCLINPTRITTDGGFDFTGLYNGTPATGSYWVNEKGRVDEYSINFGGNIMNTVFWGLGFGITDMNFTTDTYYNEDFTSATVLSKDGKGVETGSGGYGLNTWKHIWGSGFNMKFGLIFKPINELRLGLAVHTPTWYSLSQEGWAGVDYEFSSGYQSNYDNADYNVTDFGYLSNVSWKLRNPWRLIASVAGVIDGRMIISGDYEYRAYKDMTISDFAGNNGNGNPNSPLTPINDDIATLYQASNILRLGLEYRITPQFSARAGYSFESSPVTRRTIDGLTPVYTSGPQDIETTPSYTLDRTTQYITCGLGYRYKGFYVDAAYVHKNRQSDYYAFTPLDSDGVPTAAPSAKVTDNNNQIVLTVGFKF